ncbi:MAG: hypothetical protein WAV29_01695, partial [Microgenomates group bacterium]
IFAGTPLQGYNYFLDLIIFLLTKVGITALVSYFKLIPVLFFILFCYLSYLYAKKENKSNVFIACFLFFVFFGSSFTYILSLYHTKSLSSFFYAQAMQSGRMLLNLQYAVSLLPFLGVLILLKNKKLSIFNTLMIGLLLFLTTGFKLYGGVMLIFLIEMDFLLRIFSEKKYIHWIINSTIVFISFCVAILLFYNPFLAVKTGAIFIYSPFALARPMIEAADHFYMPQLVQARYYLQAVNPHSPRLFAIEMFEVGLFIFLNNGTRLVGLIYILKKVFEKKISKDEIVLFTTIILSTFFIFTFVQKGMWWNVIQFYGYTLFLMNYFAAKFLYEVLSSKKIAALIIGFIIILLTLPTNIEQIGFAFERQISFSQSELNALSKLKSMPDGIVLSLPFQSTAYVSAFTQKVQYVADKEALIIVGVDSKKRIDEIKFKSPENLVPKVNYIYIKKLDFKDRISLNGFKTIYENPEVVIKMRK